MRDFFIRFQGIPVSKWEKTRNFAKPPVELISIYITGGVTVGNESGVGVGSGCGDYGVSVGDDASIGEGVGGFAVESCYGGGVEVGEGGAGLGGEDADARE